MGSVYRRGDSSLWWLAYKDTTGKRVLVSSGSENEEEARAILGVIEARVSAERRTGAAKPGAPTVRWYAEEKWLPARRARGLRSAGDDANRLKHVLPRIGQMLLKDVREEHVKAVTDAVARDGLSPRMVHHVYGAMRILFRRAMRDKLISVSPCVLSVRDGDLPVKEDKDRSWRASAIYTRNEVERLISDERIPEYRRVLWGLVFLGGLRINEATPRRWKHYDAVGEPLGPLLVDSHWDVKLKQLIPGTKTGPFRVVPVHPVLATLLARWRLSGWAAMNGRPPTPEDLIIEAPRGGVLNSNRTLEALKEDLGALGLRLRRQHDLRRTFITLCRADGAIDALLHWVTHGPGETILDDYTTPPWASLCEQVSKLKVGLLQGATSKLRSGNNGGSMSGCKLGAEGLEAAPSRSLAVHGGLQGGESYGHSGTPRDGASHGVPGDRSNVATDYEALALALGFRVKP